MAGKANKKQRHEAKRKAMRLAMRKQNSISPIKRLTDSPGEIDCWMSEGIESFHQVEIFAFKQAAGMTGIVCFLVDDGVVGLKDSWVRLGASRKEFQEMVDAGESHGISMKRVSTAEACRWIAAGARWAQGNGMRLPKDWLRHASIIGGVGDWQTADVSAFRMEFAGHPNDLRQRLIGQSFDSFITRDDVRLIFNAAAPYKNQRTGDYDELNSGLLNDEEDLDDPEEEKIEQLQKLMHRVDAVTSDLAVKVEQWLATQSELGSPELPMACKALLTSSMLARTEMPDATPEEHAVRIDELVTLNIQLNASLLAERERAVDQLARYCKMDPEPFAGAITAMLYPEEDDTERPRFVEAKDVNS